MTDRSIVVYGTKWCGDCRVAKRVLDARGVHYTWIDIESNATARQTVLQLNGGLQSVPTILFPDGSVMVEPSARELQARLEKLRL
ncbi:MAG: NrdH-redoxin [Chloroflexota bacterium]|nr:MAG: NrdH-redoxin [Chloroflexota bacterium]